MAEENETGYVHFGGMAWPSIKSGKDDRIGEVECSLRYGEEIGNPPSREDLLFAASVMVAYKTLVMSDSQRRNRICAKLNKS